MWQIKFLSGPKAGKPILLTKGLVILGRQKNCAVSIPSTSISKEHAQLIVKEDSLEITDLNSSNGTFIDGRQIRAAQLKEGDRVVLSSEIIFEVKKRAAPLQSMGFPVNLPGESAGLLKSSAGQTNSLFEKILKSIKDYSHETILPGIYQLAKWLEFKFLMACFVGGFAVMVIVLSAIPLISILKASVEQESLNNAETIAQTLAQTNMSYLKKGLSSSLNVDYALRRPGVEKAFIISAVDGRVLAPAKIAHTYPKEAFIHRARKQDQAVVEKVSSSSVSAVVPIYFYDPETGQNIPKAYSVVIYSMDSLSIGVKKVFSLIIQTCLITLGLGAVLFFFLINLVEFPIRSINHQLSRALKEDQAPSINVDYQSRVLLDLCGHINSALNQISLSKMIQSQKEDQAPPVNRQREVSHLVEIMGFPALAVQLEDKSVVAMNLNFTEQIGFSEILHQSIEDISSDELKEHLSQIIAQGELNPQELSFSEIALNEMKLQTACHIAAGQDSLEYALITFMPAESADEGAA